MLINNGCGSPDTWIPMNRPAAAYQAYRIQRAWITFNRARFLRSTGPAESRAAVHRKAHSRNRHDLLRARRLTAPDRYGFVILDRTHDRRAERWLAVPRRTMIG
jgi:hypothetical protein